MEDNSKRLSDRICAIAQMVVCAVSFLVFTPHLSIAQDKQRENRVSAAVTILLSPTRDKDMKLVTNQAGELEYSMLLADHTNDRGHAPLGGTVELEETGQMAAARETAEESRFEFKEAAILAKVKEVPEVRIGNLAAYVVIVDYLSPTTLNEAKIETTGAGERHAYTWIPVEVIDRVLMSEGFKIPKQYRSQEAKSDYLWEAFVKIYPHVRPQIQKTIESDRLSRSTN